jgi:hypothetical protein
LAFITTISCKKEKSRSRIIAKIEFFFKKTSKNNCKNLKNVKIAQEFKKWKSQEYLSKLLKNEKTSRIFVKITPAFKNISQNCYRIWKLHEYLSKIIVKITKAFFMQKRKFKIKNNCQNFSGNKELKN